MPPENVKKIRRLMDEYSLSCPIRKANPYRRMAKALRTGNVADNLLKRELRKYGPQMVLLTDITYLPDVSITNGDDRKMMVEISLIERGFVWIK